MKPVAGIFGNTYKPEVFTFLKKVTSALKTADFDYLIDSNLAKAAGLKNLKEIVAPKVLLSRASVVLSLGGDGTFLNTAQIVGSKDIPILGINMGRLGYFSEISPGEIDSFFKDLRTGNITVTEQVILQCEIEGKKTLFGLNDIVIDKSSSIKMLELETFFNKEKIIRIISDGIIISTPSGSTAYSLSCNGPIVNPQSRVILITPISPHTLNVRPIVVPDTEQISITVLSSGRARITSDGQTATIVKTPSEIRISKAPYTVKAIKRHDSSYFQTLKKKLHWGDDVRLDKKSDQ